MKRLENNSAVRNSVLALAYHFKNHQRGESRYPFLQIELPDWGELTYLIKKE